MKLGTFRKIKESQRSDKSQHENMCLYLIIKMRPNRPFKNTELRSFSKTCKYFFYNRCFVIDLFSNIPGKPCILRCDTDKPPEEMVMPPFLRILRDVTNEIEYQTGFMAMKSYSMNDKDAKASIIEDE